MQKASAISRGKKAAPAKGAKRSTGEAAIDFDGHHYQQMLAVLKQFRVVVSSLKTHYRDVQTATGVSGTQLWALYGIAVRPGIKVGDLARELAVHQSTASNLLDRLVELGYVERRREGNDQRVVTLYLTTQGKRVVDKAPQPAIGMLQQALMTLPETRLAGLHDHLAELIRATGMKRATGGATPLSISLVEDRGDD